MGPLLALACLACALTSAAGTTIGQATAAQLACQGLRAADCLRSPVCTYCLVPEKAGRVQGQCLLGLQPPVGTVCPPQAPLEPNAECQETDEASCRAAEGCVWCESAAVGNSCFTEAQSQKLPAAIFTCKGPQQGLLQS